MGEQLASGGEDRHPASRILAARQPLPQIAGRHPGSLEFRTQLLGGPGGGDKDWSPVSRHV
jgi:hypothetical protein